MILPGEGYDPLIAPDEAGARASLVARFPDACDGLDAYATMLATKAIEWGLIGPREGDKVWSRHIGNSLALVDVLGGGLEVADVGSGAGLPGLPLALVRPDLSVTLVEPLLRRATFLSEAVVELGLDDRVSVERVRAEDLRRGFGVVVCRAVAPLERLLKWTTPLFLPAGELVALKGLTAEREVAEVERALARSGLAAEILELRVAPEVEPTRAIRVKTL